MRLLQHMRRKLQEVKTNIQLSMDKSEDILSMNFLPDFTERYMASAVGDLSDALLAFECVDNALEWLGDLLPEL